MTSVVLVAALLLIGAFGQHDVARAFNSPDCSTGFVALSAGLTDPNCAPMTCGQCFGNTCITQVCNVPLPSDSPPNPFSDIGYSTSDCSGGPQTVTGLVLFAIGVCYGQGASASLIYSCDSVDTYQSSAICTGNFTTSPNPGVGVTGCIPDPGVGDSDYFTCGSSPTSNSTKCFHEDTSIIYEGETLSFTKIKNGHSSSPCVIPHEFKSNGFKFTTSCEGSESLRVTGEHLVFTQNGLVIASTIKQGDFLFQQDEKTCEVLKIEIEENQSYFGLNCEESIVFANGYKTSTFGVIHSIPAFWMKFASKVIGIKTASALGDVIASIFGGFI